MEQLPFLPMLPRVDWSPPRLSALPQSWEGVKRVCIDFESKDPQLDDYGPGTHRPGNYVAGIAIAIEDGPAHYLPIRHEGGDNMDEGEAAVWRYLDDRLVELDDSGGTAIAANAQYELAWMLKRGVRIPKKVRDPQVAEPLIWELHKSYKLDAILKRWDLAGKDEEVLRAAASMYKYHPKRDLWRLPGRFVAAYGVGDARKPLPLLRRLEKRIEDEDLTEVYDLESKVTPILARMRHRGVKVNLDKVDNVERWARRREAEILDQIASVTGRRVTPEDTWDKGAVKALFDAVGVEVPMSEAKANKRGKVTAPTPVLDKKFFGGCKHELGKLVIRWREVNKCYTTFCKRTREHAVDHGGGEWRVHCTFNQLRKTDDDERESVDQRSGAGTRTGRFSSDNYNLQQELSRSTEVVDQEMFAFLDWGRVNKKGEPKPWTMAEVWKDVYEPDGPLWGDMDYSQQEPRIEVHFAELVGLRGAKEAADRWRANPRMDGHQLIDDMIFDLTGVRLGRSTAKNTRLALGYGAGGGKLCDTFLFLPTEWKTLTSGPAAGKTIKVAGPEGQKVIDAFNAGAPFVKELSKLCTKLADRRGWIRTLLGRVIHFEKWDDNRAKDGHAASNSLCQGGAASQAKKALVDLVEAGFDPQMTVHDAFGMSVESRDEANRAAQVMVDAVPLKVPVVVDVKVGVSIGQAA
jgi:DNA polymerase I-like protein with 3'-5' exonuclease and polymerase domains